MTAAGRDKDMERTINKIPYADRIRNINFRILLTCSAVVSLVYNMQCGVVPLYLLELGGTPTDIGVLSGISSIVAMFFRIPVGRMLDRRGRQPVYLAGALLYIVGTAGFLMFPGVLPILVCKALCGVAMCGTSLAIGAIVSDLRPTNVTNGLYSIMLVQNIGNLFATSVGISISERWGYNSMFIVTGIGFAIAVVLVFSMRYEKQLRTVHPGPKVAQELKNGGIKNMIEPTALVPAVCMIFHGAAHSGITGFIAAYGVTLGIDNIGFFYIIYGVVSLALRPLLGKYSARRYDNAVFYIGVLFFALSILLLLMSTGPVLIGICAASWAVAYSCTQPILNSQAMSRASLDRIGAANATYYILWDFGFGAGSILLGMVATRFSYAAVYIISLVCVAALCLTYTVFHVFKRGNN